MYCHRLVDQYKIKYNAYSVKKMFNKNEIKHHFYCFDDTIELLLLSVSLLISGLYKISEKAKI